MFDIECQRCGRRVLVTPRRIESIVNDEDGIAVHYRCPCGEAGVWRTGRARRTRGVSEAVPAAAPAAQADSLTAGALSR
ncbi:MAG TPA: hypothetical protein VM618_11230 [Acidimicrobiia bacterium]|nr:hypothetical protein [Acidimicrobiia bacterium]